MRDNLVSNGIVEKPHADALDVRPEDRFNIEANQELENDGKPNVEDPRELEQIEKVGEKAVPAANLQVRDIAVEN